MTPSTITGVNTVAGKGSDRPSVSIDPAVLSGTPCLFGKRLPVYLVADMAWGDGVWAAMSTWGLTRPQVLVACWFAGTYGVLDLWEAPEEDNVLSPRKYRHDLVERDWLGRWRTWAQESAGALWSSDYDAVADPPRGES